MKQLPKELVPRQSQGGDWWFRLTAPDLPPNPTFEQREKVRRGRLASITILAISLFSLFPLLQGLIAGNPKQSISIVVNLVVYGIALFTLNKRGYITAAGWIVIVVLDLGFTLTIVTIPGGLAYENIRSMDLLVVSVLVIVAFFPPRSVFIIAAIHTLIIVLWTCFGPHNGAVAQALNTNPYSLLYPSIAIEAYMAVLVFLWVNSAVRAIKDLDVSERMVELERVENERQAQEITLKKQLEEGVQLMLETHVKAANGDFTARAPLTKENILWKLAYSLNNLLARLERFTAESRTYATTQEAIQAAAQQVRLAKATNQPLVLSRTGTPLDALLLELNALQKGSTEPSSPPSALPSPRPNTPPMPSSRVIPMPSALARERQEKTEKQS